MSLKALQIRALLPAEKLYRKTDERGLYLEIRPSGSKTWFFKYRFAGLEKRMSLGPWPEMGLAEAREKRDELRKAVRSGEDPAHTRKMVKVAARISAGSSFQAVAEDFIAVKFVGDRKAPATIDKARWFLSHLTKPIGSRPISEIEPAEILAVIKKLEREGKRETAHRTRSFASRVFRHGVAMAMCKADPASLLSDALSTPIVKHHAAILDPSKLGVLLRAIEDYSGSAIVKLAMQLSPHVYLRPGELRKGRWEEIDWGEAIWRVPPDRMKLRRQHSVPLSQQSIAILRELQQHSGGFELMFPGVRRHTTPMCENAVNSAFRRMGFDGDTVTAHGLRSTASTLLNESGKWHFDAIERALAHGHSNAVRGAYARGQHWEERVEMAQWWSDYLEQLRLGGTVVPIHKLRAV